MGIVSVAALGCSSDPEDAYRYDAQDMRDAVLGAWAGSYEVEGSDPLELSLTITEPVRGTNRLACSNRTFSERAGQRLQCASTSSLAVSATLSVEAAALKDVALDGEFFVPSLELDFGTLSLSGTDNVYGVIGLGRGAHGRPYASRRTARSPPRSSSSSESERSGRPVAIVLTRSRAVLHWRALMFPASSKVPGP
jgi:hypothetical protein